jgi:hypothetical protein
MKKRVHEEDSKTWLAGHVHGPTDTASMNGLCVENSEFALTRSTHWQRCAGIVPPRSLHGAVLWIISYFG